MPSLSWDTILALALEYIAMGGWVMPPLLFALVLLWYGIGYRLSVLKRGSHRDVRTLIDSYIAGDWRTPKGIITDAIVKGVAIKNSGVAELKLFLDDAFAEYDDHMQRFVALIRVIVNVAPLLGLLGTVTGMIETFDSLQDNALFSQSGGIAGGISQALLTTQLGLSIAIPGLIVQSFLNRRQSRLQQELNQVKDLLMSSHPGAQHELEPS